MVRSFNQGRVLRIVHDQTLARDSESHDKLVAWQGLTTRVNVGPNHKHSHPLPARKVTTILFTGISKPRVLQSPDIDKLAVLG